MLPRGSFSNSVNSSAPDEPNSGRDSLGAFAMPIRHSRFSFGVGFVPDLASVSNWHYVDAPGTAGATYGLQEQKSAILAGRAIAGLGVVVNPKLSLGFHWEPITTRTRWMRPTFFSSSRCWLA